MSPDTQDMDLVFFGIQGSGKGTQAKRLAEDSDYYIFETGGELRKVAASGSELGNTVKEYVESGRLVPFEITMQMVRKAVMAQLNGQPILFDGMPRDEDQMVEFDSIMEEAGRDFRCIHIVLDRDEAVERIKGRAKIEGRADDADMEKVNRRMDTFEEKTMPVIERYKEAGLVVEIDGSQSEEEVYAQLKEAIEYAENISN